MTVRVLGVDPSTACTGVALPDGTTTSIVPAMTVEKGAPPTVRARRLAVIATRLGILIRRLEEPPDVAVVESYVLHHAHILTTLHLAEVGGVIRFALDQLRIPFVEIPPSTLKRWATGKGGADKTEMIKAARAAGGDPANSDEADAFHLRSMGVTYYGDGWADLTDEQRLVLSRYPWPDVRELVRS